MWHWQRALEKESETPKPWLSKHWCLGTTFSLGGLIHGWPVPDREAWKANHMFLCWHFLWSFEAQKTGKNWCPKMPVLCIELRLKSIRFIPNHPGMFCEPKSTKGHPKCRYALHFPHGFIGIIKIRYHPANLDLVLDLFTLRAPLLAHCCSAAGESLRAMI